MTTVTVNIQSENDLVVLEETLHKLGFTYQLEDDKALMFTESEISDLAKTRQDFIDGKTTARDWADIEKDLARAFN